MKIQQMYTSKKGKTMTSVISLKNGTTQMFSWGC